jgi:hypothetical protein
MMEFKAKLCAMDNKVSLLEQVCNQHHHIFPDQNLTGKNILDGVVNPVQHPKSYFFNRLLALLC